MQALPPDLTLNINTIYAAQGSIYVLEASNGTVRQRYPLSGVTSPTVVNDMLYINVNNGPEHTIQALRASDGALLWSYRVEDRLAGSPTVIDAIVYAGTVEGTIYALQAADGTLLWHYSIDLGAGVPSFLGPILFAPPTIANEVVYIAPAVNHPLVPFVYALQAKDGHLLGKFPISDSTTFPLVVVDDVMYISTHSSCLALHAHDGAVIWQHEMDGQLCSPPLKGDGMIYISFSRFEQEALLCSLRSDDGSLQWQRQLGAGQPTTAAASKTMIYVGISGGLLMALEASKGTILWQKKTGGNVLSSPVVGTGSVYVGASDGCVYAVRAGDGAELWKTCLDISLTASASISIELA